MFPISDSIKSKSFPILNITLIAATIFSFIQQITTPNPDQFIQQYSLIPRLVDFSNLSTLLPFVTAIFLHGGLFHIASNMWFLHVFGDGTESRLGKIKFLLLYLFAGVAGNVAQYFINPTSSVPMLGASGAISGILGAYYILFPESKIKTLLFIFFFVTVAEIPAVIYLFYWFIVQVFSGIASTTAFQSGGIAFWAHAVGFVTGVFFARAFKRENKGYIEGEIVG